MIAPSYYGEEWVLIVYKICWEVARMSLSRPTDHPLFLLVGGFIRVEHDWLLIHQPTRTSWRWIMEPPYSQFAPLGVLDPTFSNLLIGQCWQIRRSHWLILSRDNPANPPRTVLRYCLFWMRGSAEQSITFSTSEKN